MYLGVFLKAHLQTVKTNLNHTEEFCLMVKHIHPETNQSNLNYIIGYSCCFIKMQLLLNEIERNDTSVLRRTDKCIWQTSPMVNHTHSETNHSNLSNNIFLFFYQVQLFPSEIERTYSFLNKTND